MKIRVKIINGNIVPYNLQLFSDLIVSLKDGEYILSIEKEKKNRSIPQNRYYWGVVIPILQQPLMGLYGEYLSEEDIHHFLKTRFNSKEVEGGISIPVPTSSLTPIEFNEYLEKISIFADEFLNIIIPEPNEDDYRGR